MAASTLAPKINAFIDDKYIPLDNKIKAVVAIVVLIAPLALFYFLSYTPAIKNMEALNQQKLGLLTEIAKAKKAASELDKIKADIAATEQLFKETANLLPKSKEIPALLRNISDLGKGSGLEFVSFKPNPEIPKDFYSEIPVDIMISGPYHNVGYFLDLVSKLERIVTVNNISIGSPQKDGPEMIVKSNVKLTTYRFTGIGSNPDQNAAGPAKR